MQATTTVTGRQERGLPEAISTERIEVASLWEGVWPLKLANTILPPFVVLLRFTMGWIFVYSGFDKLLTDWTAQGYLANATKGPLAGWFQDLAANTTAMNVIDPMVVWGEILIGLALVFGVMTRWAAFWGAVMLFMFYISAFPPEHNPFMEYHLVYILVLGVLGALGAGRILGLDNYVERLPWVRRIPGATFLLG